MCGIAGIVAPDPGAYRNRVERMVVAQRHRGPDASGLELLDGCALGHSRLSVVDLTSGDQPMRSPIGAAAITFNGEIYGYQEIRGKVPNFPYRTKSDTEVILALYDRYGQDLLGHLPGMFAFAIWDEDRRELFCARDRFGEKPFYYAVGDRGEFVFASELKGILASGLVRPALDRAALAHYLQYLYVPPDRTIYSNIHTLPPAHSLTWKGGRIAVNRYWSLPEQTSDIGLSEAADRLDELLITAVRRQLVADVPVGAFLSGGLDSSSIVAAAARLGGRIQTYSFAFAAGRVDETEFARPVAERWGCDHHEMVDTDADLASLLRSMAEVYDEPFADSSNIATYLISKLARDHLTVVLTGDGGDELFGGYSSWYRPLHAMASISPVMAKLTPVMVPLVRLWEAILLGKCSDETRHFRVGLSMRRRYPGSLFEAHRERRKFFSDADISSLGLTPALKSEPPCSSADDPLDDVLREDLTDYMPGDILVKTDRASMAHGLELRAPFLDVDLASFCISLPSRIKINTNADKIVLREAERSYLPDSVLTRAKMGFGAPISDWLQRRDVKALKDEYLNDSSRRVFDVIPFEHARHIIRKDDYRTWALLVLALWADTHEFDLEAAA